MLHFLKRTFPLAFRLLTSCVFPYWACSVKVELRYTPFLLLNCGNARSTPQQTSDDTAVTNPFSTRIPHCPIFSRKSAFCYKVKTWTVHGPSTNRQLTFDGARPAICTAIPCANSQVVNPYVVSLFHDRKGGPPSQISLIFPPPTCALASDRPFPPTVGEGVE